MRLSTASSRTSYTPLKTAEFTSKNLYKIMFSVLKPEVAFTVTIGILYVKELLPNGLVSLLSYSYFHTSVREKNYGFAGFQYCEGKTDIKMGLISRLTGNGTRKIT